MSSSSLLSRGGKENVRVTVRFRPLSEREKREGEGEEVRWYGDGEYTVRHHLHPSLAYRFDRVFHPATPTLHVYDVAAHGVVCGAMAGINGTVFAYGVTSSGKTHTMHGDHKSPGLIPLAIKHLFAIIQDTPDREFLLRLSYLEIYNEVINDLLNPTGHNLRIREDSQGIHVEAIKQEVVLSPAHALSLIASGQEHRHVGSNSFNLLSSRSHTIFTLTIESSPRGEYAGQQDVTLSQLHLIDLAGSESSRAETTGLRRKEGSFINKSLLTLGTVISKLTDGKATHIPYRDSKLTRLLQSSLSGHGRISLICTVTPASSSNEETHNTLKFAHRSKYVEIKASQNKIMDEKSLIKKYQKEIFSLKQELQQLKRGMAENPDMAPSTQEDVVNLKLQLEAGQVKLQSRLEEEEEAKAALMGRIQRLTKLILVSTKNSLLSTVNERPGQWRRHSFGEDELAYLPEEKREYAESHAEPGDASTNLDEVVKDYTRNRRRVMHGWFKLNKLDLIGSSPSADGENPTTKSPASNLKSLGNGVMFRSMKDQMGNDSTLTDSFPERNHAGDLFSANIRNRLFTSTGTTSMDQMDLLREQVKMLEGDVALCSSSLKRMSERRAENPEDPDLKEKMHKLKDEIRDKKGRIRILEQHIARSVEVTPRTPNSSEASPALSTLTTQLNEKIFELEIKSADNRILQEQLQMKISENTKMQETILILRQQIKSLSQMDCSNTQEMAETYVDDGTPRSVMSLNWIFSPDDPKECDSNFHSQLLTQAHEIENLKQEKVKLVEERNGLEIQCQKLAEEAVYAKELASAATVELRNLAEEITRLSYENVSLSDDLAAAKESLCKASCCQKSVSLDFREMDLNGTRHDGHIKKPDYDMSVEKLQKELNARYKREAELEASLYVKEDMESQLQEKLDEVKKHEEDLENELANKWVLVAKMRKGNMSADETPSGAMHVSTTALEELDVRYQKERRCDELESLISKLKGEDVTGLDATALEVLQDFHMEAIAKICHSKCVNLAL